MRLRAGGVVGAAVTASGVLLALVAHAGAAPMAEIPVGGDPGQVVWALAPGADASVWFVQQWLGTASTNPGDRMRVGRLDADGHVVASAELEGNGSWTGITPTSDGGVWLLRSAQSGGLVHLDASAAVTAVVPIAELPVHPYAEEVVAGPDDAAWTYGCRWIALDHETCSAVRVSLAGEVTSYPLPSFSSDGWSSMGDVRVVAAGGGVWLGRSIFGSTTATDAAFVSFGGEVSDVSLPLGTAIVGSASGSAAWWRQNVPRRFGRVTPAGTLEGVRDVAFDPSVESDYASAAAGRDDTLVWAAESVGDASRDGRIALLGATGDLVFDVPMGATAVQEGPSFWTGSCVLGGGPMHIASDGAAWVVSTGHPDRISRLARGGGFTTFIVPSASTDINLRLRDVTETTDGKLWYAVETQVGPRLARADPLDPPEGLPGFPAGGNGEGANGEGADRRLGTRRSVRFPGLRLAARQLSGRRVRVTATVRPAAVGRLRLAVRVGQRTIRRSDVVRRSLSVTLRTRRGLRIRASFVGGEGWGSRTARLIVPALPLDPRRAPGRHPRHGRHG